MDEFFHPLELSFGVPYLAARGAALRQEEQFHTLRGHSESVAASPGPMGTSFELAFGHT